MLVLVVDMKRVSITCERNSYKSCNKIGLNLELERKLGTVVFDASR